MRIQKFEDVLAWQKAKVLTVELRANMRSVPDLTFKNQIFRASLSIMNNIAEGFDRGSDKELRQFLIIARGSTAEVRSMLIVAEELGYIHQSDQQQLVELTQEISKMLTGFIKKLS